MTACCAAGDVQCTQYLLARRVQLLPEVSWEGGQQLHSIDCNDLAEGDLSSSDCLIHTRLLGLGCVLLDLLCQLLAGTVSCRTRRQSYAHTPYATNSNTAMPTARVVWALVCLHAGLLLAPCTVLCPVSYCFQSCVMLPNPCTVAYLRSCQCQNCCQLHCTNWDRLCICVTAATAAALCSPSC